MATFAQLYPQLYQSIRGADKKTLEATLISMCQRSADCLIQATSLLLVPEKDAHPTRDNETGSEDEDEDDDDDSIVILDPVPNEKKRKLDVDAGHQQIARYRTCITCMQVFDVTQNNESACKTHDGEKEVDAEYFPDDDDIQYGPGPASVDVDNDWRVDEFPEGFPWSCCGEPADDEGCIVQSHRV